ncbi:MAG: LysR family transcriptional regulator [Deltaproteobacteria bacterium]|nr:LysR family transcriptional regulator [Deltaproteobacteria bacterium]
MEIRLLEIFSQVFEQGSFSKAARALKLTQPTVSIHIKSLEDDLSCKLFDRLGRKVKPTRAGEILYGYAKDVLRLKDEARIALDEYSGSVKGKLLIGASTIPGEYLIPNRLSSFIAEFTDVIPMIRIADTRTIIQKVLDCTVDIGVIGSSVKDPSVISTKFMDDKIVLVARADLIAGELSPSNLQRIPLILREHGSGTREATESALRACKLEPGELNVVAEMGSTQAVKQSVLNGLGAAFISVQAIEKELSEGILTEITVPGLHISRSFWIITNKLRYNSPITHTFIEFLTK